MGFCPESSPVPHVSPLHWAATRTYIEDHLGDRGRIGLPTLPQPATAPCDLIKEVVRVRPRLDVVRPAQVLGSNTLEQGDNVICRCRQMLDAHNAFENFCCFGVLRRRRNNAGAVDQIDALHKGDVLPNLGLPGQWCHIADLLLLERVDDARLAHVGVADEANADLLLVGMQVGELTQQLNEGAFPERVIDGSVEGDRRVELGQVLDPASLQIQIKSASEQAPNGKGKARATRECNQCN
jgi:hypothetical protein